MSEVKAHVSDKKKKLVDDYAKLISSTKIIGIIDMTSLPSAQLAKMRQQLRGKVNIVMGKKRLFNLAIEKASASNKEVIKLKDYLKGMPALLFTSENPFSLYKTLQKSKSNAPAKPGSISPRDIVIPAGPTSFAPGPIISELSGVGIKCGIEAGKVAVKQDSLVVKEGGVINDKLSSILLRLGIEPMEIGLNLTTVYEDGLIYDKKVLAVDEKEYIANISNCARWAFNLSFEAGYPTKENIKLMIIKTFNDTKALAYSQNILTKDNVKEILAKANMQNLSLNSMINK
jgi:large subunit ribosomal protein L10